MDFLSITDISGKVTFLPVAQIREMTVTPEPNGEGSTITVQGKWRKKKYQVSSYEKINGNPLTIAALEKVFRKE